MIDDVTAEAVDQVEWYRDENLMLQDELEQTTEELEELTKKYRELRVKASNLKRKVRTIKQDTLAEMTEDNKRISDNAVALSNLVDELDNILMQYVAMTGTKLVSNKLNELRKQGGYLPYDD